MIEKRLEQLEQKRDRNLGRMLLKLERKFTEEVLSALEARALSGLKMAHIPVLGHIKATGSRAVEVAQASGISKQAAGKMIDAMQRSGLVRVEPDPDDSRARLILFTEKGEGLLSAALEETHRVEKEWARTLGLSDLNVLKSQLAMLLEKQDSKS